jgi:predicted transcriptional regulator of viral defense system
MRALWELARRQLGLITWAQAIQLATPDEVRSLVDRGHLRRVRRGVYAASGVPPSYAQMVLAAILAAGDLSFASHRTAAKLWDLLVPAPSAIDVLTLPNRRLRMPGVEHHRHRQLPVEEMREVGPVPVTSVAASEGGLSCGHFLGLVPEKWPHLGRQLPL